MKEVSAEGRIKQHAQKKEATCVTSSKNNHGKQNVRAAQQLPEASFLIHPQRLEHSPDVNIQSDLSC